MIGQDIAGSFRTAYQGYGRYGKGAALGAAGIGLLAPLAISNDERGYAGSAAITSPFVAAGFVAAPQLAGSARGAAKDFGQFWKNKPFDVNFTDWRNPVRWNAYPEAARKMDAMSGRVQSTLHRTLDRMGRDYFARINPQPYDTGLFANQTLSTIDEYIKHASNTSTRIENAKRAGNQISKGLARRQSLDESRQLLLSAGIKHATLASMTPDMDSGMVGASKEFAVLSLEDIRAGVAANANNPEFVRSMHRTARRAKDTLVGRQIAGSPHLKSYTVERMSIADAISHVQAHGGSSRHLRMLEAAQNAVGKKYVADARVAFEMVNGEAAAVPVGLEIFNEWDRSFQLPFLRDGSTQIRMGKNWDLIGTARAVWNDQGVYSPDERILNKLGETIGRKTHWQSARQAVEETFQWGGISDREEAAFQYEFANSVTPTWAQHSNSYSHVPDPYGVQNGKRFDDLGFEERDALLRDVTGRYNLTSMRDPSKGVLQSAAAEGMTPGYMSPWNKANPTWRAITKGVYVDPATVPENMKVALDSEFWRRLGVAGVDEMPFFQGELALVSPQAKTLFSALPAEAEAGILDAYREVRFDSAEKAFAKWRSRNIAKQEELARLSEITAQITRDPDRELRTLAAAESAFRLSDEEARGMWRLSKGGKQYLARVADAHAKANAWWGTEAGTKYEQFALGFLKEQGLSEEAAAGAFGSLKQAMMADPMLLVGARRMQTLGETTVNVSEAMGGIQAVHQKVVHLDSMTEKFRAENWKDVPENEAIGFAGGRDVTLRKGSSILDVRPVEDGYSVMVEERFGLAGAKGEITGQGDKGFLHQVRNLLGTDLTAKQIEAANLFAEQTGIGDILPEGANMIGQALYAGHKPAVPYDALMNASINISQRLVKTNYTAESRAAAERFIETLQANQFRGFTELDSVAAMSKEAQAARHNNLMRAASGFLDEVGGMEGIQDPIFQAYRKTAARHSTGFSDYVSRSVRFTRSSVWNHSLLNQQQEVGVTFDMLGEMMRLGHREGVAEIFRRVRTPQGDPRQTGEFLEYLKRGDFLNEEAQLGTRRGIGDVLTGVNIKSVDARMGPRSVFNPGSELGKSNASIDLGGVLRDVEIAGVKQDVRFLSKLGADAWLGAPNRYEGGWAATELEHKLQSAMDTAASITDWDDQGNAQLKALKAQVADYYDLAYQTVAGKEARPKLLHPDAITGWAAERSTGVGGENPFTILVSKQQLLKGIEDPEILEQINKQGYAYGSMFRHPVSAHMYVKYQVAGETAHLDPGQWGISSRVRSWLQMDHDQDPMIGVIYKPRTSAWSEAEREIGSLGSTQNRTLETTELLQAMENPSNITPKLLEEELAKDRWVGPGSLVETIDKHLKADQLMDLRNQTFRERLTFMATGRYSNQTTRMQLMLAANPAMKNVDADYTFMDKMLYYVRQVAISSSKGKIKFESGETPDTLMSSLNQAINAGPAGADRMQNTFANMAHDMGFTGIWNEKADRLIGDAVMQESGKTVRELFQAGDRSVFGENGTFNVMETWAKSNRGRDAIERFLSSPNNAKMSRVATFLTRQGEHITSKDALSMLQQIDGMTPEISGGIYKLGSKSNGLVRGALALGGESLGSMAEEVSNTLGAVNQAIRDTVRGAVKSGKPAFKVLGAGAAVAAAGGLLSMSLRSANEQRPEEHIAAPDHVPGEPIEGSRSDSPKRAVRPAPEGVKTAVVTRMHRSIDLDVRARAADRQSEAEMQKTVRRMAAANGNTNVTVNRVGGWRDRVSRPAMRRQIREELGRFEE